MLAFIHLKLDGVIKLTTTRWFKIFLHDLGNTSSDQQVTPSTYSEGSPYIIIKIVLIKE